MTIREHEPKVCTTCAALVPPGMETTHTEWHTDLDQRILRIQQGVRGTTDSQGVITAAAQKVDDKRRRDIAGAADGRPPR